jgi:hypothetical protein
MLSNALTVIVIIKVLLISASIGGLIVNFFKTSS